MTEHSDKFIFSICIKVTVIHGLFSLFDAENFPPTLSGSDAFQVILGQESVYVFNATDQGDNFTVTINGDRPVNSSLENSGSVYTFSWTLRELANASVSFMATDSFGAVSMLDPQVQICACENSGSCTVEGLSSTTGDPLLLNCECTQGKAITLQFAGSGRGSPGGNISWLYAKCSRPFVHRIDCCRLGRPLL